MVGMDHSFAFTISSRPLEDRRDEKKDGCNTEFSVSFIIIVRRKHSSLNTTYFL